MKNRLFSMFIVLTMMVSAFPLYAGAQGSILIEAVSGLDLADSSNLAVETIIGETLMPSVDGNVVLWYESSDGITYTQISDIGKLDGKNFIVTWDDNGKYIKCNVDGVESDVIHIQPSILTAASTADLPSEQKQKAAAEDMFTVGNKQFILLDTYNNNKSNFLVAANTTYGNRVFDTSSTPTNLYSVSETTNLGYYMENTVKAKLPADIISHINNNWSWITEPGTKGNAFTVNNGLPFTVKAGVVVPANWEYFQYSSKIGYQDTGDNTYEWLRTPFIGESQFLLDVVTFADKKKTWYGRYSNPCQYRPIFTLDHSFFLEADVSDIGDNVWNELSNTYTYEELITAYDEATLNNHGIYDPSISTDITATNVKISTAAGTDITGLTELNADTYVGQTFVPSYTYTGNNPEGATVVKWYANDVEITDTSKLSGNKLIVTWEESGKTIKCSVTPYDITGAKGISASASVSIQENSYSVYKGRRTTEETLPAGRKTTTSDADMITVDGKRYVVLDCFDNEKSTFLVVAKDTYGWVHYDSDTVNKINALNPASSTNIAYYLNNEFNGLSDSITNYINNEHIWVTEPSRKGNAATYNNGKAYYTKCGITIMADWEYVKYASVMGYQDGSDNRVLWLRTPYAIDNSQDVLLTLKQETGIINTSPASGTLYFRPQFMLNRNFFLNANVTEIGDNVWEKLVKTYTLSEMLATRKYTEAQLVSKGFSPNVEITATYNPDIISGASSILANVTMINRVDESISGVLIAALYDVNGETLVMTNKDVTIGANSETPETIGFDSVPDNAVKIKIFLWSDLETIRPICRNLTHE